MGLYESFNADKSKSNYKDEYDYMGFGGTYFAGNKMYVVKQEIYKEMFDFRAQHLAQWWEVDAIYYEIDEAVTREFLNENKINAVDKQYSKYLKIVNNIRFYNLYKNNSEINGYNTWFEYFEANIGENDLFTSVEKYLKGDKNYLPTKFQEEWNNYYSFSKISEYCETKKNQILNINTKNMDESNKNEKIEELDFIKPSVPKSIAMLYISGFFDLEKIKLLKSSKLHSVVAIIIGLDPNNKTHIRSIRGNINVLNSNSEENPLKFTASNHLKDMEKLLN